MEVDYVHLIFFLAEKREKESGAYGLGLCVLHIFFLHPFIPNERMVALQSLPLQKFAEPQGEEVVRGSS